MSENINTIGNYLGPDFQLKLLWQLLTEIEFARKVFPLLQSEYFDNSDIRRIYTLCDNYRIENNGDIPNLINKSIYTAIKTEEKNMFRQEVLFEIVKKTEIWNDGVLNRRIAYDGETIQSQIYFFIKQQMYRKISEKIQSSVINGSIKSKKKVYEFEEEFGKISQVGNVEDQGTYIFDEIERALEQEFRETIPTGIKGIDELTEGGIAKGEIALVLAPTGVGKSTILTKVANQAVIEGKNVLQIIFEDNVDDIRRKHFAIWSGIPLSEMKHRKGELLTKLVDKKSNITGQLLVKKFDQDETTILDIREFMITYQKKNGIKFDMLVLDYIDCLEPHKRGIDPHESELSIIKKFESMASEFNIPMWSAIQTNRSGVGEEWVDTGQMSGNIKRAQKTHFLMSIAKTQEMKESGHANIQILKARFASDGQKFEYCIFNNDTMAIEINTSTTRINKELPSMSADEINKSVSGYYEKKQSYGDSVMNIESIASEVEYTKNT